MKTTILTFALFCLTGIFPLKAQWVLEGTYNSTVSDIIVFENELYIGGNFTKRDGKDCYWTTRFDGINYKDHTQLIGGGGVSDFAIFNTVLHATGSMSFSFGGYGVYNWDGSTWGPVGNFNVSHTGIFADGNDLYVGSDFGVVSKKTGSDPFVSFPAFDNEKDDIYTIAKYEEHIVVAGRINTFDSVQLNNIAYWDSVSMAWQPIGDGLTGGTVYKLEVYNGELYATGSFDKAGQVVAKHIAKWDGNSWSDVGGSSQFDGWGGNGIYDMVVYDSKLFVAGQIEVLGGDSIQNVAYWDGNRWTGLNLPLEGTFPICIEVYNNRLYIGTIWSSGNTSDGFVYSFDLSSLGLADQEYIDQISIYPNPANEVMRITADFKRSLTVNWELVDMNGRRVANASVNDGTVSFREQIDISHLVPGVYVFTMRTPGGLLYREKVLKQ